MLKKIGLTLIGVVFLLNIAEASDSFSIPVSCSIPAVPGLNVPLAEGTDIQTTTIVSGNEEELLLAENQNSSASVQTVYGR